jgi:penicillin-binding protein 1C
LRFLWRLFLAFVHITLLAVVLLAVAAFVGYRMYVPDLLEGLPAPEAIGKHRPAETTQIFARDGRTLLFELVDPQSGRRTVVPFERIPQVIKDATIAVEDANFRQNPGVDVRGIVRAIWLNYQAQDVVSGGSTITQQLVRGVLMTEEERTSVSFRRKLREAILAYKVTNQYSKDQILGIYLNEVYYGNQAYGIEAAAQAYFNKHVWELSVPEATLIAGLPQSPTDLDPYTNFEGAKGRQKLVLDLMVKYGYMSRAEADKVYATEVELKPRTTNLVAPHFVFYVRQLLEQRYGPDMLYRGGLRVVTTLDTYWQGEAQRIVRERVAELRERNATNASVVLLSSDNQVLAMVGSADYNDKAIDGQVNVALAERQPGSALKPIVYAAAMRRDWTAATVIWDEPVEYPMAGGGVYAPQNYDNSWHGPQRLRMALANSLNIPAVKAIEYVGVDTFVEQAHEMGITTLNDPSKYGLALALGAGEVRLLDLTNAYSTLRNSGRFHEPVPILKVVDSRGAVLQSKPTEPGRQALGERGEQIAYLMTDILSDNAARQYIFGPENVMELSDGRPAAVKTGTSNEWRDAWTVGYTPEVTVGVWVGNSDNSEMAEIAGVNGSGVIWRDVMDLFNKGRPVREFTRPPGIAEVDICAHTGGLAGEACPAPMKELFIAGTEPVTPDITIQKVRVAGDGSCLPAPYTPSSEIREASFRIYPPEFRRWAASAGVAQPPTEPCPPPQAAGPLSAISQPGASAVVSGTQVFVQGTARGPYVLEFGAGASPGSWQTVNQGTAEVQGSLLGVWRVADLAPGEYTLRLRVTPPGGQPTEARTTVRVRR